MSVTFTTTSTTTFNPGTSPPFFVPTGQPSCYACMYDHTHPNGICHCGHKWVSHTSHYCRFCPGNPNCYPPLDDSLNFVQFVQYEQDHCSACKSEEILQYANVISHKPIIGMLMNSKAIDYGLDCNLILVEAASDFYLLYEMSLGDSRYRKWLEDFSLSLAEQLCLYLEMAALGEFRYATESARNWAAESPIPEDETTTFISAYVRHTAKTHESDPRMACWGRWEELYKKFGTKLHEVLASEFVRVFPRKTGIGGQKWANCIDVARMYRDGEIKPIMFCDFAFGLKHNGAIAYNKFWDTSNLGAVLNWARDGKIDLLEHFASEKILAERGLRD